MVRMKVKVIVISEDNDHELAELRDKALCLRSPLLGCTASWYLEGIHPKEDEKKKGSMLYLFIEHEGKCKYINFVEPTLFQAFARQGLLDAQRTLPVIAYPSAARSQNIDETSHYRMTDAVLTGCLISSQCVSLFASPTRRSSLAENIPFSAMST
jgi:hypothetical protein